MLPACRESFAMRSTVQDVCGEPGAAGGQTAEIFFSKWLLFLLGKCTDMPVMGQMKSGYMLLDVASPQVTSEHSGPSINWKHWGNHIVLTCFWHCHKWFKLGINEVYVFFNSINSKQAWKGKSKNVCMSSSCNQTSPWILSCTYMLHLDLWGVSWSWTLAESLLT